MSEEPTGGRRRLYRITDAGRDRLHAWVLTPGDLLPRLQHPLLLRLFFSEAAGASDAVRPVVDAFVAETRARAVELRELADALEADPAFRPPRAIAEWGVRFCAAEVESAGAAARALGDDTPGAL